MKTLLSVSAALLLFCAFAETPLPLPGEPAQKEALSPYPFPDSMSAFVWRNWKVVPHARLAQVVSAKESDLETIATQMGLPRKVDVLGEWRRQGYITVLRRNWHLLPYGQLLTLLDMTREELRFSLYEDDFLFIKLGRIKPKVDTLVWSPACTELHRKERERLAQILKDEGVEACAEEEPRFKFVKDLSSTSASVKACPRDDSPFDFRLISSYFADYGDSLVDDGLRSFPEGLLARLSEQGVNAVWLHTVLRTLAKDAKYPEFGEGCEKRLRNLQRLVDRARRYGIKVYLYVNEPRGMEAGFFRVHGREGLLGAKQGGLFAMCTSNPETHRWVSDSLAKVFSAVHGLGGIFTITASENLTNCATNPGTKETCPHCNGKTRAEIIGAATRTVIEGMKRGDPKAMAIVYNWAWPKEDVNKILAMLPTENVRVMAVSENGMKICRGGVTTVENDYSISIVGPGDAARESWRLADARGMGKVAKVQACNSWELSPFPYIPVMDLVAQHAVNLANEGVGGVMLSWSCGSCPAPNLRAYRDLRKGEKTADGLLDRLSRDLYGEKANGARRAWTAFSNGFTNYPFTIATIYFGPQHWGPANLLHAKRTGWSATMVGLPYDDLDLWRSSYPRETYAELMGKVAEGFADGCRLMKGVAAKKELDLYRAEQMHFASTADQARFVIARDKNDVGMMKEIAMRELERAKAFLPIVRADSRIGYESSNHYFYIPLDIVEKILACRSLLTSL